MKALKILSAALILLAAVVGSVFAGGGKEKNPASNSSAGESKILNVQIDVSINAIDFQGSQEGNALNVMRTSGEGLYYLEADGSIQPALAESLTKSPDGLTLTYKIKDALWSDGSKLTAHDFVYAWQRLGEPARTADYRGLLITAGIANAQDVITGKKPVTELGVKALDDKTLVVTQSSPVAFVDSLFSFVPFFPQKKSFVEAQGAKFATSGDTVLSNGPFMIKTYEPNGELVEVVKNPHYRLASKVKLDGIRFQTIKDIQQAALAYQSGLIDIVPRLSGEQIDLYRDDPEFKSYLGGYVHYMTPNVKDNKYLANINVRRAMALSIDREALCTNILKDGSVPAEYLVARGLANAPDDRSDFREGGAGVGDELHLNREAALRYWNQAKQELGISSLTVTLNTEDSELHQSIAQFIQAQLQQTLPGFTLQISPMLKKSQGDKYRATDFEMNLHRWGGDYRDPLTYSNLWASDQHPVWRNAEYDAIVYSARNGELAKDPARRFKELRRAEQIALRDVATVPLFQSGQSILQKSNVKGVEYHFVQGGTYYWWASKD
jgi:oligopeptide transport system substrate-binding protein